jgi:EAL and modified HD-GYP domain-containing signal transduction protein
MDMDIFVARQPIFDVSKQVVGYELLFRDGIQNCFPAEQQGDNATCGIIASGLSIGFEALTGGKRAFINFTESNIQTGLAKLVPEQLLAVEILETVEPSGQIVAACRELKKAGYQIVLDDFVFQAKYQPFIELADIIKIDFLACVPQKRAFLRKIIPSSVQLLAEKVESEEDFRSGVEMGYSLFQGYFFSRPTVISHKEISPSRLLQVQLIQQVNREDFDVAQLEDVIKRNVAFSYKLFKYINSAWFGFSSRVQSIRQAIALLGQREIRRWVSLITMRDLAKDKPAELLTTAVIRGRMCDRSLIWPGIPGRRQALSSSGCSPCSTLCSTGRWRTFSPSEPGAGSGGGPAGRNDFSGQGARTGTRIRAGRLGTDGSQVRGIGRRRGADAGAIPGSHPLDGRGKRGEGLTRSPAGGKSGPAFR